MRIRALPGIFQGFIDGQVRRVAFGRRGEIGRTLREDDPRFGHPDVVHGGECGCRKRDAVGIGIADVFGGQDDHPPRDELRILSPVQHPGHPVDRRIRIASPDALDECRNDIVVFLSAVIVPGLSSAGMPHRMRRVRPVTGSAGACSARRIAVSRPFSIAAGIAAGKQQEPSHDLSTVTVRPLSQGSVLSALIKNALADAAASRGCRT